MGTYQGGYVYRDSLDLISQNRAILAARPDPERPRYGRYEAPCGTLAAVRRHQRRKEPLCGPCSQASQRDSRDRAAKRRKAAA